MSKKQSKIFTIKLAEWLFHDPTFSKKGSSYIAISRSFLNSKLTESLSLGEFKLMISLIEECQNRGKTTIEVEERFIKSQGKALEKSLLKLNDFKYLDTLVSKEVSKLVSDIESVQDDIVDFIKENEKDFIKKFQHFVTEEMKSLDLGYVKNNYKKVHAAFLSYDGFSEFVDQVYEAKGFKTIEERRSQISYFKKALNSELDRRGLL